MQGLYGTFSFVENENGSFHVFYDPENDTRCTWRKGSDAISIRRDGEHVDHIAVDPESWSQENMRVALEAWYGAQGS